MVKPGRRSPKYRNLYRDKSGIIYYERVANGVRVRRSTESRSWDDAAAVRDAIEETIGIKRGRRLAEVPLFEDYAAEYLARGIGHLSPSTAEDHQKLLSGTGIVLARFHGYRLNEITRAHVFDFWERDVEARGRSPLTGFNYLNALSAVFRRAVERELVATSPVDGVRRALASRRRTKGGRALLDPAANCCPLPRLDLFVAASESAFRMRFKLSGNAIHQRQTGHVADLLMLDGGLRIGEVAGLRWRDIAWGRDADDRGRSLHICNSRSRGGRDGPPKSGRPRRVALSRRLRHRLLEWRVAQGNPPADDYVLPGFDPGNYRTRHFDVVLSAAGLTGHSPKCLRDSFASWLLTLGAPLGYISRQLGHGDVSVTARHYARYVDDEDREPIFRGPGDVWADLIARIDSVARTENYLVARPPGHRLTTP